MVALGGGAVVYERGTPVAPRSQRGARAWSPRPTRKNVKVLHPVLLIFARTAVFCHRSFVPGMHLVFCQQMVQAKVQLALQVFTRADQGLVRSEVLERRHFSSSLLLSRLDLRDTKVYEP